MDYNSKKNKVFEIVLNPLFTIKTTGRGKIITKRRRRRVLNKRERGDRIQTFKRLKLGKAFMSIRFGFFEKIIKFLSRKNVF